jgi:hypothetical protein
LGKIICKKGFAMEFLTEFNRVRQAIDEGKTPVYSELRSVKTNLLELLPSLIIQSALLVVSTLIISRLQMSELTSMVVLLVANTTTQTLSFSILSMLKHFLRVRVLKKYGLEITERNIAVLESMEYQSV